MGAGNANTRSLGLQLGLHPSWLLQSHQTEDSKLRPRLSGESSRLVILGSGPALFCQLKSDTDTGRDTCQQPPGNGVLMPNLGAGLTMQAASSSSLRSVNWVMAFPCPPRGEAGSVAKDRESATHLSNNTVPKVDPVLSVKG